MARMNVLFIVVDDLRPQLGCYGQGFVQSPHIDRLAADGVLFERAYCQQAVCAPSRASVLSGCRPDTTTIYDLQTPLRSVMPEVVTLPQHFKRHGYETRSIGKVYHHRTDDLEGWCAEPSTGDWKGRGYLTDEAIEAIAQTDADLVQQESTRRGLGPAYECADVPDHAYHDGKDGAAAVAALNALQDRPFFLAVGFHKPHLPFNAPLRYWDLYHREALPLTANPAAPAGVTPFSLTDFGELRGYFGMPKEGPIPDELARTLIQGYCACVSYVDAQVGRLLDQVDRLGLRENTVVMLWGDHGWKLGEHGSWCKHTNFDIDTRAPLIVRAPGLGNLRAHRVRRHVPDAVRDLRPAAARSPRRADRLMEEPDASGRRRPSANFRGGSCGTGAGDRDGRPPGGEDLARNGLYDADARLPLHGVAGAGDRRGEGAGTVRPSRGRG